MDCLSSPGQTKRSIDRNEVRSGLIYPMQYFFIAEGDMCLGFQATENTYACRTVRRTGKVDAYDNKRFAIRHDFLDHVAWSYSPRSFH